MRNVYIVLILSFLCATVIADDLVINKPIIPRATQAQAEAGTENNVVMTPLRTSQFIAAHPAGGDVTGPTSSVDSEIAIYNSTTGKLLKRFTGTGIVKAASGVIGTAVAGDFPTLNQNTTGNAATVTTNANLTGHVTSAGNAAILGAFTSANLAGALSDETGTGVAVFGTSPTFATQITIASSVTATGLATFEQASTDADSFDLLFRKERGTVASPISVLADDVMATFVGQARTDLAPPWQYGGWLQIVAAGTGVSNSCGGYIILGTVGIGTANGTTPVERMRITSTGNIGIGTSTAGNIITCPIASATDPIADAWTVHCLGDYKDIDTSIDSISLATEALEKVKTSRVSKFTKRASVDREAVEKSMKESFKNTIKGKAKKDLEDYTLATGVQITSEDYINETIDGLWETKQGKDGIVDEKKIEEEAAKKLLPKFQRVNYGLVAEDAPPEAQVHDINGNLQGVDPYALIGILWAAVQSQERRLILLEGK